MNEIKEKIKGLFDHIPRRHTTDNIKEMYSILDRYEDLLKTLEADNRYEKQVARFFETLDPIRAIIKKSNDNKASKKTKDVLFDEASGGTKRHYRRVNATYKITPSLLAARNDGKKHKLLIRQFCRFTPCTIHFLSNRPLTVVIKKGPGFPVIRNFRFAILCFWIRIKDILTYNKKKSRNRKSK